MPAVQYPFIDIAVHERVKDRFARGEAIVLFSPDFADVYWANGRGAALFGKPVIYDLIEDGPARSDVTFRQVEATGRQLSAVGETRGFLIRIASGFQRVPVQAVVERIRLTPTVEALLFAAPSNARLLADKAVAESMLEGFDDPDTHMAVLGAEGAILASSPGFERMGLQPSTARTLVSMAGEHQDRLVKRPVPTGKGYLPAAIGKVSDQLHLFFAVETILGNMVPATPFPEEAAPAAIAHVEEAVSVEPEDAEPVQAAPAAEEDMLTEAAAAAEEQTDQQGLSEPEMVAEPEIEVGTAFETPIEEEEVAPLAEDRADEIQADEEPAEELPPQAVIDEPQPSAEEMPTESAVTAEDELLHAPADETLEIVSGEEPASEAPVAQDGFSFNRAARPTRFVWKIDADGYFSEVSSELAAAVGPHAESLTGTSFVDIAGLLDLDPEGKIAELLGRRDTWSGKTIYWPIEGTSLRAPVDLAALPTYKRNREFDGFRGFGIVRVSDAIEDPQAIGLTLGGVHQSEPVAADVQVATEETHEDGSFEEIMPETEEVQTETVDTEIVEDTPPEASEQERVEDAEARPEPPVFRTSEPPAQTPAPAPEPNIIRLEERRQRARDTLTPGEQEAFREIARQLESLKRPETDEAGTEGEVQASTPADETHLAESENPEAEDHEMPTSLEEAEAEPAATNRDASPAPELAGSVSTASETEQLEILAASIPARTAAEGGLTGATLDEIPVALLVHAGDRLIHANPEFLKLSGYRSLTDLSAVGGLDSLLHHKDLEDMPDQSGGLSLVRADDQLVPVTARLQSIRWEEATALLLALIPSGPRPALAEPVQPAMTDADEERLNNRINDLQVEVDELRSILETATDGVVIIGPEGDIRSMNRSASALFDYDEKETRGKPFVMLFAHESHRAVADYLAGMTGHGVASVLNDGREVIGREASGGFIPLFMTIGKLSASNGFCAVIRDITQWKRSEEDLKSAKRAAETANAHKSDFLARVSHEIRTPLNAIIGFSDMMAIEHFGPIGHPRYVEYANDIARSGRLVLDIVNDLLDISKIEAGEMDLDFVAVGLNEAVSEAVSLVQPQAHAERVIIRTAFSDAVPDVVADLRSIKQIVLNILANAIRFTPAGGQIVVSTSYEASGSVVLRIRDTGIGMTRAELEQAMKPFKQITAGARKRGDGTGLGLPLTKAMVDANRANFSIQSAPNEGTLVEITFPSPRVLAN